MEHPDMCPVCHRTVRGDWEWSPYLGVCYQCEKENYDDDPYAEGYEPTEEEFLND